MGPTLKFVNASSSIKNVTKEHLLYAKQLSSMGLSLKNVNVNLMKKFCSVLPKTKSVKK